MGVAALSPGMRDQTQAPRERRLAERATRQHGVVKHAHLPELGFSSSAIGRMVEAGRLHPLYRGVYAVGHRAVSLKGKLLAAVYASGEGAVLSHQDAAWLWQLRRGTGGREIHVTVVAKGRRRRGRIRPHCVKELHPDDVTVLNGIPVTSLARTLLDMAEVVSLDDLRRMFEEAERLRIFDLRKMEAACARGNGRRGVGKARRALVEAHPDPPWTPVGSGDRVPGVLP
jgi:predicted transcriptional regulator of viral defense system